MRLDLGHSQGRLVDFLVGVGNVSVEFNSDQHRLADSPGDLFFDRRECFFVEADNPCLDRGDLVVGGHQPVVNFQQALIERHHRIVESGSNSADRGFELGDLSTAAFVDAVFHGHHAVGGAGLDVLDLGHHRCGLVCRSPLQVGSDAVNRDTHRDQAFFDRNGQRFVTFVNSLRQGGRCIVDVLHDRCHLLVCPLGFQALGSEALINFGKLRLLVAGELVQAFFQSSLKGLLVRLVCVEL